MPKINRYWNSDPDSLVEREPPQTYDLCKCCELVNQLVWKEKRLKRALWLARLRSLRDFSVLAYFQTIRAKGKESHMDFDEMAYRIDLARVKCRAKAEEYK